MWLTTSSQPPGWELILEGSTYTFDDDRWSLADAFEHGGEELDNTRL
ncbi:MAG: hypothetical protein ACFKPT_16595 [Gloeotrichia echinulata GP01]